MSQNNQNAKSAPAADAAAETAGNAAGAGPAAAPSTAAATAAAKKKYFGFGLVAGVAAGVGGVFAWNRWGNRVAG